MMKNTQPESHKKRLAVILLITGWFMCGIGYTITLSGLNTICLLLGLAFVLIGVIMLLQSTPNQNLRDYLIQIINKSLDKKRRVVKVHILTAVDYSDELVREVETAVSNKSLKLTIGSFKIESNTSDNLIICDVILKDKSRYVALIYDPYELYDPTRLLKLIPVMD